MADQPSVTLRAAREADLDVLFSLAADLDTWEERSPSPPAPMTRAAFQARLAADADPASSTARFVIDVDGAAVGSTSLFDVDPLARHGEVGISLLAEARGRGVGTRALAALVRYAFVRRNLRRVHLQAVASNGGALRAYAKVGFVVEGRQREHAWVRGAYEDVVVMGLLRSEWADSPAARASADAPAG